MQSFTGFYLHQIYKYTHAEVDKVILLNQVTSLLVSSKNLTIENVSKNVRVNSIIRPSKSPIQVSIIKFIPFKVSVRIPISWRHKWRNSHLRHKDPINFWTKGNLLSRWIKGSLTDSSCLESKKNPYSRIPQPEKVVT